MATLEEESTLSVSSLLPFSKGVTIGDQLLKERIGLLSDFFLYEETRVWKGFSSTKINSKSQKLAPFVKPEAKHGNVAIHLKIP